MHFDVVLSIYSSMLKKSEESSVDAAVCLRALRVCARFRCVRASDVCVCVLQMCVCARFRCVCVCARASVRGKLLSQRATVTQQSRAFYMLSSCVRAVLISSPDT